ncbi:MAG: hypothetical protein JST92_07275 [Deltaproteobacteria bacterium]|nr:hypothetical protein [Deltaproteobacteria bacterium]
MDALARTIVELAARLELAADGDVDPTFARELLEGFGARIDGASVEEREALREAARVLEKEANAARDHERAAFFARFASVFGLDE